MLYTKQECWRQPPTTSQPLKILPKLFTQLSRFVVALVQLFLANFISSTYVVFKKCRIPTNLFSFRDCQGLCYFQIEFVPQYSRNDSDISPLRGKFINNSIAEALEFAWACDLPTHKSSGTCEDVVNKVVLEAVVNVRNFVLVGRDVLVNISDFGSAIAMPVKNRADESLRAVELEEFVNVRKLVGMSVGNL